MAHYFTKETDDALDAFQVCTVTEEKHRIFDEKIRPAFEKLTENLIFVYGFYNIEDVDTLKMECLTNLYEMIPKYNSAKGAKGFSYFNVIAKNWFIQKARDLKKKSKLESELYYDLDNEVVRNDPTFTISPFEDQITDMEFWRSLYSNMELWKKKLTKKSERQVLDAIVFLLRKADSISIYSKKAIYLYLRDITGLNTKQVVTNLKKIRSLYEEFKDEFYTDGEIEP